MQPKPQPQQSVWARRKVVAISVLWLVTVALLLSWSWQAQLQPFDETRRLHTTPQLSTEVARWLAQQNLPPLQSAMVHLQSANCGCDIRAQGHRAELSTQVLAQGGKVYSIQLSDSVPAWLPAVPAVILFDATGSLIYLGPYAEGAFCSPASSFVETLLPALFDARMPAAWLNSDAVGCYCEI